MVAEEQASQECDEAAEGIVLTPPDTPEASPKSRVDAWRQEAPTQCSSETGASAPSAWRRQPKWEIVPHLEVILKEPPALGPMRMQSCPLRSTSSVAIATSPIPSKLKLDGGADIDALASEALALGRQAEAAAGVAAKDAPWCALRATTPTMNGALHGTEMQLSQRACISRPPASTPGPGPATSQLLQGGGELDFTEERPVPGQPGCFSVPCTRLPSWSPSPLRSRRRRVAPDSSSEDGGELKEEYWNTVQLQVYHFHSMTKSLGLPIFHVGVEVASCEVFFCASGVRRLKPRSLNRYAHIKTVKLGQTMLTLEEVKALVSELTDEWSGEDYNIFDFNCQTFAVEFVTRLGLKEHLPPEYVSYSNLLDWAIKGLGGAPRCSEQRRSPARVRPGVKSMPIEMFSKRCAADIGPSQQQRKYLEI